MRTACCLALLAAFISAGPVEDAADAAQKADAAGLRELAGKDRPDPWLVADELLYRGAHETALAFARAAPQPATGKLIAYVEASAKRDPKDREPLAAAEAALAAGKPAEALALIDAARADGAGLEPVRLLFARGLAMRALGRLEESAAAFAGSGEAAERLGWLSGAGSGFDESGQSLYGRADFRGALGAWERRLHVEEGRGSLRGVAATLGNLGIAHESLGSYAEATSCQERALKLREEIGDQVQVAIALLNLGALRDRQGSHADALSCMERALKLFEGLGHRAGMAAALGNMGLIRWGLGDYPEALSCLERSLEIEEELGNRAGAAGNLVNIGLVQWSLGSYREALASHRRAFAMLEELGDRARAVVALTAIGGDLESLGSYAEALSHQERALKLAEEIGDRGTTVRCLINIGNLRAQLGAYPAALRSLERGLELAEGMGARADVARTLGCIGRIHEELGADAEALSYHGRALKVFEELGSRADVVRALGNIGGLHERLGSHAEALAFQERSRKLSEEIGDRAGEARALANRASIHAELGSYADAMAESRRALAILERLGAQADVAVALVGIADLHEGQGSHAEALVLLERAKALAISIGALNTEVTSLSAIASVHLALGHWREASVAAHEGVAKLPLLVGRLSEELGASARQSWAGLVEKGIRAAVRLGDPADAAFFLENGRAGTLLESLGGRAALLDAAVPPELAAAERDRRAAVAAATAQLARAREAGKVETIRAARVALDAARVELLALVGRIQRDAKAAAEVVYPEAKPLDAIRGALAEGDALVCYALLSEDAVALVVTRDGARIVELGGSAPVEGAIAALRAGEPGGAWEAAAAKARGLLVEPLELPATTKRLLLSPDGALAYVPFALLDPREIAYVPSGTALTALREDAGPRGEGVLALGDPDYGTPRAPAAVLVLNRRAALVPLPGTRAEAKAVGDVVLLGKDATPEALRDALARRPRWRAVHLACHGLVDAERPQLSSLALSPAGEDDGFLTTFDVFRWKTPADLVVLSACETARGKVYRSEGVVGFVRAFMVAGAPRVIVSLWKVDDDATRALMERFYEGWKGGAGAARALKDAQQHVAAQAKWSHPRFWAAWQLWGLPE